MRRVLPILLLALALGCGPVPDGKIQLRYMAWGNPEQMALEEKFCQEFSRRNPDVSVKYVRVPNSAYKNKMIVMLASRTATDVMRVDHYDFPGLVRKGYFYDMTDLAAADPKFKRGDFFESALKEGEHKGRLFGMNVLFGGYIIYYNKNLVREAGLEDPNELAKRGVWDMDRFRQHAIAMSKVENGRPVQFGVQIPGSPFFAPFVWSFGGQLLSEDRKRCLMDSPESIKALQFLADLRWKDKATPTPAQGANSAFSFESGKLGMEFNWMGMSPRYRKSIKNFEWDICPVPAGPAGQWSIVKGNQMVMYSETRHPEAAWRFVQFMTGPEVEMELYGRLRRAFPVRKSVAASREFLDNREPPHNTKVFVEAVAMGRELPIDHRWSEWLMAFNSEFDALFSGRERDAGVVLRRATAAANRVLADEEGF